MTEMKKPDFVEYNIYLTSWDNKLVLAFWESQNNIINSWNNLCGWKYPNFFV